MKSRRWLAECALLIKTWRWKKGRSPPPPPPSSPPVINRTRSRDISSRYVRQPARIYRRATADLSAGIRFISATQPREILAIQTRIGQSARCTATVDSLSFFFYFLLSLSFFLPFFLHFHPSLALCIFSILLGTHGGLPPPHSTRALTLLRLRAFWFVAETGRDAFRIGVRVRFTTASVTRVFLDLNFREIFFHSDPGQNRLVNFVQNKRLLSPGEKKKN